MTGLVEATDGSLGDAAVREVAEETGLTAAAPALDLGFSHTFTTADGRECREHAFAVEVHDGGAVVLSEEDDDVRWLEPGQGTEVLGWPAYCEALRLLLARLEEVGEPNP